MVTTINTRPTDHRSVANHRLIKTIVKLSPIKRWSLSILLFVTGLVCWHQLSPASFKNAWLSNDQQAALYFNNEQYKEAAALFESQQWKAHSSYLSGNFVSAIEQFERLDSPNAQLAVANAYAHSGQFETAQTQYQALYQTDEVSDAAKENFRVVSLAIEKIKNAPPEKSTNKSIDDRQIASEESDKKADKTVRLTDQAWLNQVRQNPSNFLRQKFQSEYANEQK
jgi:hypothetical protein